jgi:ADP-ribosylation factor GTPase-activating protein 2/3
MSENIPNEIRDLYLGKILSKPSNQICFDCGSKGPKWSSPYLGIVICYECTGRHRSYGTHISFVRSVDLDKWTRKQLRSLEITGNDYAKEKFTEMGIPKVGSFYDYNNDLVLKYRKDISEKVKEDLEKNPNMYMENKSETLENENNKKKDNMDFGNSNIENNDKLNENDINKKEEVEKEKENQIQQPTHFEINKKEKVENLKIESKGGKKNKIKKVDFDFDFDSFNNINFSDFNNKKEEEEEKPKNNFLDDDEKEEEERNREKKIYSNNSYNIKMSKEEVNKKFANKKAISSEDYAALEDDDSNDRFVKNKIKSMGNTQAISSDDVYGTSDNYQESFGERLKDMAVNFTLKAAEKAKELKNKTNEYINRLQNQYGS